MAPSEPLFTVIVPTRNNAPSLEATLSSIDSQSDHQGRRFAELDALEILVIDDASNDATSSLLKSLKPRMPSLRVLRNPIRRGVSGARNRGIKQARGEYLAFCDGDDVWHPQKLEAQLEAAQHHVSTKAKRASSLATPPAPAGALRKVAKTVARELRDAAKEYFGAASPYAMHSIPVFSEGLTEQERTFLPYLFVFTYFDNIDTKGKRSVFKTFTQGMQDGAFVPRFFSNEDLTRSLVVGAIDFGAGSTLFAHRSAILRNGFYDTRLGCGEDGEYNTRHLTSGGEIAVVPYPMMTYRLPARTKQYDGQEIHFQVMTDKYRCKIAEQFGGEAAREFIDTMARAHMARALPGKAWNGAAHELTVLQNAPCTRGSICSLEGEVCKRPAEPREIKGAARKPNL